MKTFSKLGYVVVLMANFPHNTTVEVHCFEAGKHADHKRYVKEILSGWTQGKDKIVQLQSADTKTKTITPFVIETEDGEDCDIFAQLIT